MASVIAKDSLLFTSAVISAIIAARALLTSKSIVSEAHRCESSNHSLVVIMFNNALYNGVRQI